MSAGVSATSPCFQMNSGLPFICLFLYILHFFISSGSLCGERKLCSLMEALTAYTLLIAWADSRTAGAFRLFLLLEPSPAGKPITKWMPAIYSGLHSYRVLIRSVLCPFSVRPAICYPPDTILSFSRELLLMVTGILAICSSIWIHFASSVIKHV
jgi:hypothetical protein